MAGGQSVEGITRQSQGGAARRSGTVPGGNHGPRRDGERGMRARPYVHLYRHAATAEYSAMGEMDEIP
jgi:hypothetical protein